MGLGAKQQLMREGGMETGTEVGLQVSMEVETIDAGFVGWMLDTVL